MTTSGMEFIPAIKIMSAPIGKSPLAPFKAGDRLTVVCTFTGEGEAQAWADVYPIPVVCTKSSQQTVDRSLATIVPEHWEAFEQDLAGLKNTTRKRLQFV